MRRLGFKSLATSFFLVKLSDDRALGGKGHSNNLISMAIQFVCQYKILNNIYTLQPIPTPKIFFLISAGKQPQAYSIYRKKHTSCCLN